MNNEEILELLMSAQINFENLEQMTPLVSAHPIYKISKSQLDQAVEEIRKREEVGEW